jgi:hypothetical protein
MLNYIYMFIQKRLTRKDSFNVLHTRERSWELQYNNSLLGTLIDMFQNQTQLYFHVYIFMYCTVYNTDFLF